LPSAFGEATFGVFDSMSLLPVRGETAVRTDENLSSLPSVGDRGFGCVELNSLLAALGEKGSENNGLICLSGVIEIGPGNDGSKMPRPQITRKRNRHRAGRDEQPRADGRGHGQVVVHLHFGNPFCNKNFEAAQFLDPHVNYCSDDNLCKDLYLRQHMDGQGWVPLSLIAGFRQVSLQAS
jgi:hypothetical protein